MPISPAAALAVVLLAVLPTLAALANAPDPAFGAPMVSVFAPWRDAAAIAAAAGGVVLAEGRWRAAALSYAPSGDHAAALRRAGAWAVLPADAAGLFCATKGDR